MNTNQLKTLNIIIRFIFIKNTLFRIRTLLFISSSFEQDIGKSKISATNFWSRGSSVRHLCSVFGAQILEILETRSKQLWAPSYVLRLYIQPVQSRINLTQSINEKTTKQPINSFFFKMSVHVIALKWFDHIHFRIIFCTRKSWA